MNGNYLEWPGGSKDTVFVNQYRGNQPVGNHRHEFLEIVFMLEGACTHHYLDTSTVLVSGDVFIVVPHEEHSYAINSETVIANLLFYPGILGNEWSELKEISGIYNFMMLEPFFRPESNKNQVLHFSPEEFMHVIFLLKSIQTEQENRQKGFKFVQKAYLISMLSLIGRTWEKELHAQAASYKRKKFLLSDALDYISNNIKEDLTINDIAARVFLSPDYFRKVFKAVTGVPPIEYINKLRMAKAEAMLRDTMLTVSEIAERVGINDISYFSKLFHAAVGCTPTDYRRKPDLS